MKIENLLKLSVLELLRFKSVSLFLVLNLSIGLIGFFILQIFQQSLSLQSAAKAQIILGGDLAINARRTFTEDEVKKWEAQVSFVQKSKLVTLFSMLRAKGDSRLANVAVFDDNYPLYGTFKFSSDLGFHSNEANKKPYIWGDLEVQELLDLKINDLVEIGESQFIYAGAVIEDPSRLFRGASFAPRVFIHQRYLNTTGLLKPGSTFTESWFYKLDPQIDLITLKSKLETQVTDPTVRINTTQNNAEDFSRVMKYFTDYLGLVALVALGLCFLCGSYLLQWAFLRKKKTIAIYKSLGRSDEKIIFIYLLHNFIISLVACVLSMAVVQMLIPLLQKVITQEFKLPLELIFSSQALLTTGLIAIFGPMLIVVPQIIQIINLRPLMLLQNVEVQDIKRTRWYFIWLSVVVVLFWMLAAWQSHSFKIASIFTLSLVGLILLFQLVNRVLLSLLEKISTHFHWLIRYAIKGLTRRPSSAGLVFTTMCLSVMVLSLLPHIKSSIVNEVKPQNLAQMPSLFMFDIQPEQVAGLQLIADVALKQKLVFSPLVRSRILKINDKNYERVLLTDEIQTREAEEEARFRNRGINLTYRANLQESERTVDGVFEGGRDPDLTSNQADQLPQISIEKRYAERMKMAMGDIITFDVQGVEVKAQVGSLRQVRWTSFQPNFFILFPIGVLEEAPQIFLASVSSEQKNTVKEFQKKVVAEFKNISIIDVSRTIENSLRYIDQMSLGLQFMSWLAVLVGILIFVVLLNTQINERLPEMNLLQILGSSNQQILLVILIQFLILITTSIAVGILLGLILAWVILSFFFDIQMVYDGIHLFWLCLILIPVCGLAFYMGQRPLKKLNPMDLIRQN